MDKQECLFQTLSFAHRQHTVQKDQVTPLLVQMVSGLPVWEAHQQMIVFHALVVLGARSLTCGLTLTLSPGKRQLATETLISLLPSL